ncbi:MAG: hypothetical protein V2I54_07820 [Bacteroidales bacterium]|jgi:hypothetical protein|nr:hypothetical protein [Bacteroidales bacterium]
MLQLAKELFPRHCFKENYVNHNFFKLNNMNGGCIDAWLKNKLTEREQIFLLKYVDYINSFSLAYSIAFKIPEITSKTERNKIIKAIGYLPAYELVICGFADDIFLSGEAIIKEFDGYLKLGVGASEHEFNTLKGEWHYIKKKRFLLPFN